MTGDAPNHGHIQTARARDDEQSKNRFSWNTMLGIPAESGSKPEHDDRQRTGLLLQQRYAPVVSPASSARIQVPYCHARCSSYGQYRHALRLSPRAPPSDRRRTPKKEGRTPADDGLDCGRILNLVSVRDIIVNIAPKGEAI